MYIVSSDNMTGWHAKKPLSVYVLIIMDGLSYECSEFCISTPPSCVISCINSLSNHTLPL